jgi:hypothetical protein
MPGGAWTMTTLNDMRIRHLSPTHAETFSESFSVGVDTFGREAHTQFMSNALDQLNCTTDQYIAARALIRKGYTMKQAIAKVKGQSKVTCSTHGEW